MMRNAVRSVAVAFVVVGSGVAQVQGKGPADRIRGKFDDVEVRAVLRSIVMSKNASIVIGPRVRGNVTIELDHDDVGKALGAVAGKVGADMVRDDFGLFLLASDIWVPLPLSVDTPDGELRFDRTDLREAIGAIGKKANVTIVIGGGLEGSTSSTVNAGNWRAALRTILPDDWVARDRDGIVRISRRQPRGAARLFRGSFDDAPVATILQSIGETAGRQIELADGVDGRVTAEIHGVPYRAALRAVARAVGADAMRSEDGSMQLVPRPEVKDSEWLSITVDEARGFRLGDFAHVLSGVLGKPVSCDASMTDVRFDSSGVIRTRKPNLADIVLDACGAELMLLDDGGLKIVQAEKPRGVYMPGLDPSIERVQVKVGRLVFDGLVAGPTDGELVILLHGFPQTSYSWRHQLAALAKAGYRAFAPDQRGYSPGARPERVADYGITSLVTDVIGLANALGGKKFHVVGHDWGGAVAWVVATAQPGRVKSIAVMSTPHYAAFGAALAKSGSDQAKRSAYFAEFAADGTEHKFLANDAARLRGIFAGSGASKREIQVYVDVLGTPAAMRAALNWYSAMNRSRGSGSSSGGGGAPRAVAKIRMAALYAWGTKDMAFGRAPAEATANYVAGPYKFVELEGIGHWVLEQVPDRVSELLVEHVRGAR